MPDLLDITTVDFKPLENAAAHHTSKYQWQDGSKLVIRRGQPVKIQLITAGFYVPDQHVLVLEFEINEKVNFEEADKFKRVRIRGPREAQLDDDEWRAEITQVHETFIDVQFTMPPKAPVMAWNLKVLTGLWSDRNQATNLEDTFYSRLHSPKIYCLFNPFHPEDEVYLIHRQLQEAYMFQDGELYFTGTAVGSKKYSFSKKPWMHSQFDENTLKVSIFLLTILTNNYFQNKPGLSLEERGNAVRISRKLSYAVNRYLLRGNWDKEVPEDGRPATSWLGTAEIIEEFMRTKRQVKYSQCWVFACSFVTVLRSLGIPCRTVTCIESAHDADMSLTVDRAYLKSEDGRYVPLQDVDGVEWESTWNFHVWTEVWMKRDDLPEGYDGWQVVDATPQERSDKLFQCGPMSVKAIKEGRLELPYDGWFIYSEVNADLVRWFYERDQYTGRLKLITAHFKNDTQGIGRALLTPNPRNYGYPMDLTSEYKAAEGTDEERLIHIKALKSAGAAERHERIRLLYGKDMTTNILEDVEVVVEEIDKVFYGEDIVVELAVKNFSHLKRTVKLAVELCTLFHTGTKSSRVSYFSEDLVLEGRQEETVRLETPIPQYARAISFLRDLGAHVSATVEETGQVVFVEEKFQITGSSVVIEAPSITKIGVPVVATITFQNPLNELLDNIELILHSGNLSRPTVVRRFPKTLGPKRRVRVRVKFRAIGEGPRLLVATVNCTQIANMTSSHYVKALADYADDKLLIF